MAQADGEYIGFVDSDDTIEPQMYQVMIQKMQEHNADVAICNYKSIQPDGKVNLIRLKGSGQIFDNPQLIREGLINQYYTGYTYCLPNMVNKVYKTAFIREHGLYVDTAFFRAEDYWFNFDVLKKAACVVTIDEAFYNYWHVNINSVTCQMRDNRYEELKRGHKRLIEENNELKLLFTEQAHKHFLQGVQGYILYLTVQGRKQEVLTIFKDPFYQSILSKVQLTWWGVYIDRAILSGRYHLAYELYRCFIALNNIKGKLKNKKDA